MFLIAADFAVSRCSIGAAGFRPGSGRVHEHTTLGSRLALGTPSGKRSVGTHRAASMQDTLSERTARAAQLAASAVTASAVGGSATRSVVTESLRRRAARRGARAIARRARPRTADSSTVLVAQTVLKKTRTKTKLLVSFWDARVVFLAFLGTRTAPTRGTGVMY